MNDAPRDWLTAVIGALGGASPAAGDSAYFYGLKIFRGIS